jgi:hypothetical protein
MVASDRDLAEPGRFGRWLTDVFNDWGPGGRAAAASIRGPRVEDVLVGPDGTRRPAAGVTID